MMSRDGQDFVYVIKGVGVDQSEMRLTNHNREVLIRTNQK